MPELHVPSYQYLGPFTNLEKRLKRGDPGINPLDRAARDHDIFYSQHQDSASRHLADKELENKAWDRVKASDSSIPEKIAAYLTTNAMKVKRKLGMGCCRKIKPKKATMKGMKRQKGASLTFGSMVKKAKTSLRGKKIKNVNDNTSLHKAVKTAIAAIGSRKGAIKGLKKQNNGRIIPIPKTGGVLPLIPILAGLSKVGAIAGGASTIVNAIRDIVNLRKSYSSSSQKIGEGLFLTPYRKGYGLYLAPSHFPKN